MALRHICLQNVKAVGQLSGGSLLLPFEYDWQIYGHRCGKRWRVRVALLFLLRFSIWSQSHLQVTSGFELYLCFSPLGTKAMAVSAFNKLLKWIRKEEDRLFILSPLTY